MKVELQNSIIDICEKQSQGSIPNSSTNEHNTNGITKYEISW